VKKVEEPWHWSLKNEIGNHVEDERRKLLRAFVKENATNIHEVIPKEGDVFNSDSMVMDSREDLSSGDVWLVWKLTDSGAGYKIDNVVIARARVKVCTADWWVLEHSNPIVAAKICNDELLGFPGGMEVRHRWRASLGFLYPEDMRGRLEFSEANLDEWRTYMVHQLSTYYESKPERRLCIIGNKVGEAFEPSTMIAEGVQPTGDAVVVEAVTRDGYFQYGISCRGGNPLLFAVVRTKRGKRVSV
jgi:hypothetical protein